MTTATRLAQPLIQEMNLIDQRIHPAIRITENHACDFVFEWLERVRKRARIEHGTTTIATDQGVFRITTYGLEWKTSKGRRVIRAINGKQNREWRDAADQETGGLLYADLAELIEEAGNAFELTIGSR